MGWDNYHLHQFTIGGIEYGQPHPDYGTEVEDERKVRLYQVAPEENVKFSYEYDFGDNWELLSSPCVPLPLSVLPCEYEQFRQVI